MKKVLSIVAVAALATLYSCGGAADASSNEVDPAAPVEATAPVEEAPAPDASAAEAATAAEAPAH